MVGSGQKMAIGLATAIIMMAPAITLGATEKLTLKLGGNYCNFYLDDVTKAVKKVAGVRHVSYNKAQDRVYVTGDSKTLKESDLINAIDAVKGSSWNCEAHSLH